MTAAKPRRRAIGCGALVVLALAGCAAGPAPEEVRGRATAVFDDLVAELEATDTAVLRTVEVLPEARRPCGDGEDEQASRRARAAASVTADEGAVAGAIDALAATLDPEAWQPVSDVREGERAWSSAEGIVVTLVDDAPVLLVTVFPPCGV